MSSPDDRAAFGRYARVALPVPLLKTFHYGVANDLGDVRPGARVRVGLGNRTLVGCVVGIEESAPDLPAGIEIKPVLALLDETPVVSERLLSLGAWMADYYLAPPGDVFRSLLPPETARLHADDGPRPRTVWAASLTGRGREALLGKELDPTVARVLTLLATATEPAPLSTIKHELALTGAGPFKSLARRDWIRLEKQVPKSTPWKRLELPHVEPPSLTEAQASAVLSVRAAIEDRRFFPLVLHGVTGSGKTEVYLRAVELALAAGRTCIVLVPEIALTARVAGLLQSRFKNQVAIVHSALGTAERRDEWWRIRRGEARVVIGARRAVLAPVENLGLVVVDEEHEGSYKQDESPRYQARDVAVKRAKDENAVVILGSATPSLESYARAQEGRYELRTLPDRVGRRALAAVRLIDMKAAVHEEGSEVILSAPLRRALLDRMEAQEQAIVLLNRRGYTTQLLCGACGLAASCSECSVALTLHRKGTLGVCHYCGLGRATPSRCDVCGGELVQQRGYGTEKIEEEVRALSEDVRVERMDRDTMRRKGSYEALLSRFGAGEVDVLVGTQMLAKGHDFPDVTLVGVLAADAGLGVPDFRAAERTFQLLTQVAGRAGRGALSPTRRGWGPDAGGKDRTGEVLIQTFNPDHYALEYACAQDFLGFFDHEIAFRRSLRYPPSVQLVNLIFEARSMPEAMGHARRVATRMRGALPREVEVLGPAFAPRARVRSLYRCQVLVKLSRESHRSVRRLIADVASEPALARVLNVDVDPMSLA